MAEMNQGSGATQRTADHSAQQQPLSEIPAATKEILMTVLVQTLPQLSSADLERVRAALDSELNGQTSETQPLAHGKDTPLAKETHHLSTNYSSTTRLRAVRALSQMGADAVPALISVLNDSFIGEYAATALAEIGKPALPELIRTIHNGDSPLLQGKAADVLGRIGAVEAVSALKELMSGSDAHVATAAAYALSIIKDPTAVIALIEALQGKTLGFSFLQQLIVHNNSAAPVLLWVINDKRQDSNFRAIAIKVLPNLRIENTESAAQSLISALQDKDPEIRREAANSLRLMKCKSAVPALIERLKDPHVGVRANVAHALGEIGDTNAIKPLNERLGSMFFRVEQDEYVRSALVDAIRRIENDSPSSQPRRLRGILRIYP